MVSLAAEQLFVAVQVAVVGVQMLLTQQSLPIGQTLSTVPLVAVQEGGGAGQVEVAVQIPATQQVRSAGQVSSMVRLPVEQLFAAVHVSVVTVQMLFMQHD
jgi:hypothetical protein